METSYLKVHQFGNRYPEWMPNLHSNRGQQGVPLYVLLYGYQYILCCHWVRWC